MPDKEMFLNTFVCHNSWMYMVDLNLCTARNIIIVHPKISIFISCLVVVCLRITICYLVVGGYFGVFSFLVFIFFGVPVC